MNPFNRSRMRQGRDAGTRVRIRIRMGFFWTVGFILGFIGVGS